MDLNAGYPFWLIKSGLPYSYPYLEKNLATDVLIMGAGISGALMAFELVKRGIKCTVIDSRTVGLGSTCGSTSLLQYEIDTPLSELSRMIGKDKAVNAYNLCSRAIDELEKIAIKIGFSDFERGKSLYYAAAKKDMFFLEKEFNARKEAGFELDLLNENSIWQRFKFSAHAAILSQQAAQTNAYDFTHELLQYGMKKGLEVYDRTKGLIIKYKKNKILLTTDKGYSIKANHLVYATGYESLRYIDDKYLELKSTYAVCSEQMNKKYLNSLAGTLFWNTADPYLYMRLTSDNRILIGGRDENFYDPIKRDKLLPAKVRSLTADFKKIFPGIAFKPEFSWAGTFGSTKDGLPFIGKYKKLKNTYFSLGFGGNGITFSLVAAKINADLITGKKNKHQELFSFERI
ncbi:MAG: FAD-binding oxidoreductase [Ferruginibacter sp.]